MKTPHKALFMTLMVSSTLMVLSSSNWLTMWMGLEINMMGFIPLMFTRETTNESETAVKYLIPQSMGSTIFIATAMMYTYLESAQLLMLIAMCLKLGAAPLHLWFPPVMSGLELSPAFILLTWQKIAPIFVINAMDQNTTNMISMIASISAIWGSIGGLNQTNIQSLLTYSSIAHTGWMIASIMANTQTLMVYMTTYIFINLSIYQALAKNPTKFHKQLLNLNQDKNLLTLTLSILSLAGLPPFTGFIMKLLVIYTTKTSMLTISALILGALISLFFYLSLTFSPILKLTKPGKSPQNLLESPILFTLSQILPLSLLFFFL
uniref:NADH-ubiquinone oxidoreductase chain 2 n=1 Tax=Physunio superbus TaxID=2494254 RepID=A0A8A3WIF3_9BIVA|nr:NADH dehydrogenase subunit 2 [Physunio superbus]QTA71670.1 NADH dehydrogenase subunit 2 [Physunio superbus]